MTGPVRYYANNAERQRAYRRRRQETHAVEEREAQDTAIYAYVLQEAVNRARAAGDGLAHAVQRDDPFATLRALVEHFHEAAGTPPEQRPWKTRDHPALPDPVSTESDGSPDVRAPSD